MNLHALSTERTRLRQFTPGDMAGVRALMTDAEVMRFTGYREPQSEEFIRAQLAKWCAAADAPLGVWCVEERESHAFLGWGMLRPTTEDEPELGFMFLKSRWNDGYATEVAAALLDHAFSTLSLERVTASVSAQHAASIRVLGKIGMNAVSTADDESSLLSFEIAAS
jgi:RimJ/RimL family protein N-acetyltransferase